MSSSADIDDKKKDILVLRKGLTQGLEHMVTAERMYLINFTVAKRKFRLSLRYNRANSYLFVSGTETYKLRAKDCNCENSIMPRNHFKRLVTR